MYILYSINCFITYITTINVIHAWHVQPGCRWLDMFANMFFGNMRQYGCNHVPTGASYQSLHCEPTIEKRINVRVYDFLANTSTNVGTGISFAATYGRPVWDFEFIWELSPRLTGVFFFLFLNLHDLIISHLFHSIRTEASRYFWSQIHWALLSLPSLLFLLCRVASLHHLAVRPCPKVLKERHHWLNEDHQCQVLEVVRCTASRFRVAGDLSILKLCLA